MSPLIRRTLAVSVFAVFVWLPVEAKADPKPVVSTKVPEHAVGASFGFDPGWNVGLGYAHGWRHVLGEHDARLDVQLEAPAVLIPTGLNWRATAGFTGLFHVREPFQIATHVGSGMASSRNELGTKLAWILQLNVRPGYYDDRGHVAADIGYRTALATRVWHSDLVASTFDDRYPPDSFAALAEKGPEDGWYALRSHRLRAGLTGGLHAGRVVGFYVSAGFQYTPQPRGIVMNPALGTFPFYANVGVDVRWPRR